MEFWNIDIMNSIDSTYILLFILIAQVLALVFLILQSPKKEIDTKPSENESSEEHQEHSVITDR